MYRTISALAAIAMTVGTLAFATPAHAASTEDSVTISLEGLSPGDPADSGAINRRIRNAARDLCGTQQIQPLRQRAHAAACEKAVVADAEGAVETAARQGVRSDSPSARAEPRLSISGLARRPLSP